MEQQLLAEGIEDMRKLSLQALDDAWEAVKQRESGT
jgi:hypothetical protein